MRAVKRLGETPGVYSSLSAEKYDAARTIHRGNRHELLLKYIACINHAAYHAQVLLHQNKEPISAIVGCLMRPTEGDLFFPTLIVCY